MAKTNLDNLFDYGIDHRHRVIYLGSSSKNDSDDNGVDFIMAEYAIKGLMALDMEGERPITVILNSPGGEEVHGMAIYDAISSCQNHITGMVYGEASSMGSVILQACDERVMSPSSIMLIHNGDLYIEQTYDNAVRFLDLQKKYTKVIEDIYLEKIKEKHPRFTRKRLQELLVLDTYLMAKDAVELGLADKILGR
jgi:ATP-dependent Clp protease protease subunit